MKIFIKNMICRGSKYFVLLELEKLGLSYSSFELGEVSFVNDISYGEIKKLDESLHKYGLEILFKSSLIVNDIREAVMILLDKGLPPQTTLSKYISDALGLSYTRLNEHFLDETGFPIEEYFLEKQHERGELTEPKWSDVLVAQTRKKPPRFHKTVKN